MTTTTTLNIEALAAWTPAKRVETKAGPRNLRKAAPGGQFWDAWRANKEALRAAGVTVSKDRNGNWELCWWQSLPQEERDAIEAAQAASRATDAATTVPAPEGLAYLPFQRAGIEYARSRQSVLIADEMGLGKTIQAVGIWNSDDSLKRCLVVCPASLRLNWAREFSKWSVRPITVGVVDGGKASDWPKGECDVVVVNYDVLQKHRQRIDAISWDLLVADECHYLKNAQAARTKAVLGWVTREGEVKQQPIAAKRRAFLTGTPVVNRPIELFPLVQALDPKGLGRNFFSFAKRYANAHHNGYGWDFSGACRLDELQRFMRERFMVRRLKMDVLTELPPKRRQVLEIPANGASDVVAAERAAMQKYEETLADLQAYVELAKAGTQQEYDDACEEMQQAVRVAFEEMAAARHDTAVAKIEKVVEHLESCLEAGAPIVCFAHHRDVVHAIAEHFGDRCVTLTGETPMDQRQAAVDRFQAGEVELFCGNIQAAGVGLTLTRSSHVVFAELDWVPGNMTQAEDRCHRIGQTQSVLVQHIVLEGSLDAVMAAKLVAKQEVIDRALDRQTAITWESPLPARERPATAEVTRDGLDELADKVTPEQAAAVHLGLRMLAGMCDGARSEDGCGYSKVDVRIGHSLARIDLELGLSKRQAALGQRLITKYRRQLPDELVIAAGGRLAEKK